jgi:DeoR family fructose operon transcriptional repressor
MNLQKRKNIILDLLDEKGEVSVKQLAEKLATSEITVRRDLASLTADGLVYRTHGGVMKVDLVKRPVDFAHKVARNIEEKDHICRLAASEIQENDIIFMDCGSTVFRLCPLIKNKSIRVITNSLPVVYELAGSRVQVNLVGGEVDADRLAVHGAIALEHIGRYKADKAFLGVDGISAQNGLSAQSEREASITLAMLARADQTYLLCDSSKLGKDSYLQFARLNRIQVLITDKTNEESRLIAAAGVKVIF